MDSKVNLGGAGGRGGPEGQAGCIYKCMQMHISPYQRLPHIRGMYRTNDSSCDPFAVHVLVRPSYTNSAYNVTELPGIDL